MRSPVTIAMVLAASACAFAQNPATSTAPTFEEAANLTLRGIVSTPITLKDGIWEGAPVAPGASARPQVFMVRTVSATGDLTGDATPESVMLLASSSGGTGSLMFALVVGRVNGRVEALESAEIGDRVKVRKAWVADRRIEMDVLRSGPQDAMCCPGELAHLTYAFNGDWLKKTADTVTGRAP